MQGVNFWESVDKFDFWRGKHFALPITYFEFSFQQNKNVKFIRKTGEVKIIGEKCGIAKINLFLVGGWGGGLRFGGGGSGDFRHEVKYINLNSSNCDATVRIEIGKGGKSQFHGIEMVTPGQPTNVIINSDSPITAEGGRKGELIKPVSTRLSHFLFENLSQSNKESK